MSLFVLFSAQCIKYTPYTYERRTLFHVMCALNWWCAKNFRFSFKASHFSCFFPLLSIFLLFICLRSFLLFCSFHLLYSVDSSNNNNFPCSCSWCIDSFSTIFFYLYVFFHYHTPRSKMAYSIHVCVYARLRMWVNVSIRENTSNKNFSHLFVLFIWFVLVQLFTLFGWMVGRGCCWRVYQRYCCWLFLMMILYISFSIESKFVHTLLMSKYTQTHTHSRSHSLLNFATEKKRTKQVNVAATTTNIKIDRTPKIHSHNF